MGMGTTPLNVRRWRGGAGHGAGQQDGQQGQQDGQHNGQQGQQDGQAEHDQPQSRVEREGRVLLWLLLAAALAAILIPSILLQQPARVFFLKLAAIGLLAFLPGWLYLQFIRNRGPSLYDEYVLNLFRLHIDEYRNLPAPPVHSSYHQLWRDDRSQPPQNPGTPRTTCTAASSRPSTVPWRSARGRCWPRSWACVTGPRRSRR